ncbi:MAG TPA: ribosome small subunit-dependent GTPase A, partial [Planctomycetota bacterium]|nr:ribosome small subunit-dependent GTPase A [Planctomycetota bacterium]
GCEVVPAAGGPPAFAKVRGRIHRFSRIERTPLAPGDRVEVAEADGGFSVRSVHPRKSRFLRESSAGARPQVLAANVDLIVAVLPCAEPEPSPRLADRILVCAASENVEGAVLLTKADLATAAVVADLEGLYRLAGVTTLAVSVPAERGLVEAAHLLRGRTSVLVGPSGAGKTTLLRRLLGPGGADLRIGAVNAKTGKGRHTTTAARLLPFPGGGWTVDTAGVRTLALGGLRPADVALHFPDLADVGPCRFADCSHTVEPGCALAKAAESGRVDPRRLESCRAIIRQIAEDESRRRGW